MIKEMFFAVTLTLIFSVGVGVLFVRTLAELMEMFLGSPDEAEAGPPTLPKRS
ncbi:MAG: hypothetical protein GX442_03440 [Candidatus Riflebacteria bacterium]|nr:hypothetical protein [Candidatus Riflebacteria bacterium]